jgi:hypothetical protein
MEKSYVLILDSSWGGGNFVLTISETGNTARLPGRKFYEGRELLERDLMKCLNVADAKAALTASRSISVRNTWTAQTLLTDECAARLGWVR